MIRKPLAGPSMLLKAPLQTTAGSRLGPDANMSDYHAACQGLHSGPDDALVRSSPAVQQQLIYTKDAQSMLSLRPLGQASETPMKSASEDDEAAAVAENGAPYDRPLGMQVQPNNDSRQGDGAATASEADKSADLPLPTRHPYEPTSGTLKQGQKRYPHNTASDGDQPPLATLQRYLPYASTDPHTGLSSTAPPKFYLQRLEPLGPVHLPPQDQLPAPLIQCLQPQPQRQHQQLVLLQRISPHGIDGEAGGSGQQDMYVRAAVLPPAYTTQYHDEAGLSSSVGPLLLHPGGVEQGLVQVQFGGMRLVGRDLPGSMDPQEEDLQHQSLILQPQRGSAPTVLYPAKSETEGNDLQAKPGTNAQPQMPLSGMQVVKVESFSETVTATAVEAAPAAAPLALKGEPSDGEATPSGAAARGDRASGKPKDERAAGRGRGAPDGRRMGPAGYAEAMQRGFGTRAVASDGSQFWDLAALAEAACRASELDREEQGAGGRKRRGSRPGGKGGDGDEDMSDRSESYSARGRARDAEPGRVLGLELEGGGGGAGSRAWRARKQPLVDGGGQRGAGSSGGGGFCGVASLPLTVLHTDRKNPKVLAPRSGRVGDTKHLVLPAEIVQVLPDTMLDGHEPVQVLALMPAAQPHGSEGASPRQAQPMEPKYEQAGVICHVGNGPGGFPALHLPVVEAVYGRPVRCFTLRPDLVLELELGEPVVRMPRGSGGGGKRTAAEYDYADSDSGATGASYDEELLPASRAAIGKADVVGATAAFRKHPQTLPEGMGDQAGEQAPSPRPLSMETQQQRQRQQLNPILGCPRTSDDADGSCMTGVNMMQQQGVNSSGPYNEAGGVAGGGAGCAATGVCASAVRTAAAAEAAPFAAPAPAGGSRRVRGGVGTNAGSGLPIIVRRPLTGKPTVMRSCTGVVGSKKHLPLPQDIIKNLPFVQVSGLEPIQVDVVIVPPTSAGEPAEAQLPFERLICAIGPTGSHGCTALQVPVSRGMNGRRLVYIKLRSDLVLELGLGDVLAMMPPKARSITAATSGNAPTAAADLAVSAADPDVTAAATASKILGRAAELVGNPPPYKRHCSSVNAVGSAGGGDGSAADAAVAAAAAAPRFSTPSPTVDSDIAVAFAAAVPAAGGRAPGVVPMEGAPSHQQQLQRVSSQGDGPQLAPPPLPVAQQPQLTDKQHRAPAEPQHSCVDGGDVAESQKVPYKCRTAPLSSTTQATTGSEVINIGGTAGGPRAAHELPLPRPELAGTATAAAVAALAMVPAGASSWQPGTDGGMSATAPAVSTLSVECAVQKAAILGRVWGLLRQVPRVQLAAAKVLGAVRQRPAEGGCLGGGDGAALAGPLAGFRGCLAGILNLLNSAREAAAADGWQRAAGAGVLGGGDLRVCHCLLEAAPTLLEAAECLLEWYSLLSEVQDESTAVSYAVELGSSAAVVKAQLAEELAPLLPLQGMAL